MRAGIEGEGRREITPQSAKQVCTEASTLWTFTGTARRDLCRTRPARRALSAAEHGRSGHSGSAARRAKRASQWALDVLRRRPAPRCPRMAGCGVHRGLRRTYRRMPFPASAARVVAFPKCDDVRAAEKGDGFFAERGLLSVDAGRQQIPMSTQRSKARCQGPWRGLRGGPQERSAYARLLVKPARNGTPFLRSPAISTVLRR